jgi:hypothetical protein
VLFSVDPGYGATKLARLVTHHFGGDPTGPTEIMPTKATNVGGLPIMKSREFAPEPTSVIFDLNALRASEPPVRRPSSSQSPRPRNMVVQETVAKPTFDPRDEPVVTLPREDEEDEATTFYTREEGEKGPTSQPFAQRPERPERPARESRGPQRDLGPVPKPKPPQRKPVSEPPPADEATVIDSSGEFASHFEAVMSGVPRRLNADAPMMVEQRAIRVWTPPKPSWEPLPFVGPPLPVKAKPARSSFTLEKRYVYIGLLLFVLSAGLGALTVLLQR